jgi:hypothetical protein
VAPSFLDGLAGVLDIGWVSGPIMVLGSDGAQVDREAIGSDWKAVGNDLRSAMDASHQVG